MGIPFLSFCSLIALATIFCTMLNGSGQSRYLCLLIIGVEDIHSAAIRYDVTGGFFMAVFVRWKEFPSFPSWSDLITKGR